MLTAKRYDDLNFFRNPFTHKSMTKINQTHDPGLASWVESANRAGCDFSIQNLPFAIFRRKHSDEAFRGGVAIGDFVVDLKALSELDVFSGLSQNAALASAQSSLNDYMAMGPTAWSARDIQAWEYQPLGPFLSKNFPSTISLWIVTMEVLAHYRAAFTRLSDDPYPLSYLTSKENSDSVSVDIKLEVLIQTESMRENGQPPEKISSSNFVDSYWTIAQMVAHHTVNGCNLRSGDLFGSGTQSGPKQEESGSFLELSEGSNKAINLSNGEQRIFIEDGDSIIIRGSCENNGAARIGFGEVISTALPAI